MPKETFAVKLDTELIAQLKQLQGEYDSGQEFGEALLLSLKEKRSSTDTESPVQAEQLRVRKALSDIERLVAATLEIAASDKIKAEEGAAEKVAEAQGEVSELKETIKGQAEQLAELKVKATEQAKQIQSLEQAAESLSSLKEAWTAKEQTLTARIAELDGEAKEARELKKQVAELKELLSDQEKSNLQLRHQNEIIARDAQLQVYQTFQVEKDTLIDKYEKQIQALNIEIQRLLAGNG